MPTEDKLQKEGWELASITGGDHLRKTLAMYHELEIETHLEEISPKDCAGCMECYQANNETIYRIYTRMDDGRRSEKPTKETS
jgi:protein-arginine kinase activator protein McsA